MSVGSFFLKTQKLIVKNAPTILAVVGAVGAGAATFLAVDGTLKAQEEIAKHRKDVMGDDYYKALQAQDLLSKEVSDIDICKELSVKVVNTEEEAQEYVANLVTFPELEFKEKAFIYCKYYFPAALTLGVSVFCIFSGLHISKKRIAQLTGAYLLSQKSLKEYKDKVEEVVGKSKAQTIEDNSVQDKVLNNPATGANTYIPSMGNQPDLSLWYDVTSDRYFYSNIDIIKRTELEAQKMLEKNGSISLNDIYGILGIKEIPLGDDLGWEKYEGTEVFLETGAVLDDKGNPVGTLSMEVHPSSYWLGEV